MNFKGILHGKTNGWSPKDEVNKIWNNSNTNCFSTNLLIHNPSQHDFRSTNSSKINKNNQCMCKAQVYFVKFILQIQKSRKCNKYFQYIKNLTFSFSFKTNKHDYAYTVCYLNYLINLYSVKMSCFPPPPKKIQWNILFFVFYSNSCRSIQILWIIDYNANVIVHAEISLD